MAEAVQFLLEDMIPELEDFERKGLFTKTEIKSIVKKRKDFEYTLRRRDVWKGCFISYVEYEENLDALRVKRKARLGIFKKNSASDYSIKKRIHFIFQRAIKKFRGDVDLWLRYVEFCKRAGSFKALNKVFAQFLQYHPTNVSVWILAAKFEFEQNANITAARRLMQRGIRINSDDQLIWKEYFRLELLYLEKIILRRNIIMGVGLPERQAEVMESMKRAAVLEAEEKLRKGRAGQREEEGNEDEDGIKLAKLDCEDDEAVTVANSEASISSKENFGDRLLRNEAEGAIDSEAMSKYLKGEIPRLVRTKAFVAFPEDLHFRVDFADVYTLFRSTIDCDGDVNEIYTSLLQEFPHKEEAWDLVARKQFKMSVLGKILEQGGDEKALQANTLHTADLKLDSYAEQIYRKAVQVVNTPLMWELFLNYYVDVIAAAITVKDGGVAVSGDEAECENLVNEAFGAFSGCFEVMKEMASLVTENGVNYLSESSIISVAEAFIDYNEYCKADHVVEQGLSLYETSPCLWKLKIYTFVNNSSQDNLKERLLNLISLAMSSVFKKDILDYDVGVSSEERKTLIEQRNDFISEMLDTILSYNEMGLVSDGEVVSIFEGLLFKKLGDDDEELVYTLCSKLARAKCFQDAWVNDYLAWAQAKPQITRSVWYRVSEQIMAAQKLNTAILEALSDCRRSENFQNEKLEEDSMIYSDMKRFYDQIVASRPTEIESWLAYVRFELDCNPSPVNSLQQCTNIHFRAMKSLKDGNSSRFHLAYDSLMEESAER
eukprot:Nk52_evm38s304 gene=Nk52_evmTU38s304